MTIRHDKLKDMLDAYSEDQQRKALDKLLADIDATPETDEEQDRERFDFFEQ